MFWSLLGSVLAWFPLASPARPCRGPAFESPRLPMGLESGASSFAVCLAMSAPLFRGRRWGLLLGGLVEQLAGYLVWGVARLRHQLPSPRSRPRLGWGMLVVGICLLEVVDAYGASACQGRRPTCI